ncbi:MAG TPA: peptide chain release factor 1 [Anaerolineae bacterium]|nr:peptide chain release factor 1 [Anaerolineae bacterium]
MIEQLAKLEDRFEELGRLMADPAVVMDYERVAELSRERAGLNELVLAYRRYRDVESELTGAQEMAEDDADAEMAELARSEVMSLTAEQEDIFRRLRLMLLPTDPNDQKNVIMEVRAGTGGDEAGLFGADLYRMYERYAEGRKWKTEILSTNRTGVGGFKQIVFQVRGRGAYSRLKYESGVHRVQRVPETESQGRIHTSTATVAVLPEMDEVEVNIKPADLDIEVYTSSGLGGQHMQKNSTAIRITHKPSGLVVTCENERSLTQNKLRAMAVLRARLYEIESTQQAAEQDEERRSQVGSGERSEKIRTYNFPQNRVTDHRIGMTIHRLDDVIKGDLDEFIDEMATSEQAERLQAIGAD